MLLHDFVPSPIFLSFGPINVFWYGFFVVSGILAAIITAIYLAKYFEIKKETIIDLGFWLIIGGILGARIYHIFLEWPYYASNPLNILKIWNGGLAIHGAIIGGLLVILFYCQKFKLSFEKITALIVPGLALGQSIGRWGNYFNQELFGLPTTSPWGIFISPMNRPIEFYNYQYFHPTFLYESFGSLIIFIILLGFILYLKNEEYNFNFFFFCLTVSKYKILIVSYLVLYSVLRFSLEFVRIDPTPIVLGLKVPQVASLLIIFSSFSWVLLKLRKCVNNK